MKTVSIVLSLLSLLLTAVISPAGVLQRTDPSMNYSFTGNEDKTQSPYFFVKCDDPESERLPLKSTKADVNISGVIADVTVTQIYKNEGNNPIEALYVFPASTRAAVYGMKMTIGERVVNAKIKRKDEARREYEEARKEGKSASLLEQHRPNVFQMNVANIMPGDEIYVELKYTELLVPTDKIYEFVHPTVVGPRFSNKTADSLNDKWVDNPYLHEGDLPTYDFDINVNIAAGMPVRKILSISHKIDVNFKGKSTAVITLDSSEKQGGNRDFILRYGLTGKKVESGLLLYKGEKENFFLLMMQPPERVRESDIPGREYIFIVDVSGSMHGFPLEISKDLMRDLIDKLRPADRFNVLLFAGESAVMSERSIFATEGNIQRAINFIDQQHGSGSTNILPALKTALAMPKGDNYSRSIVIATDGYVNVEEDVFDLIRNNLGNANMFVFGIGSSVNRHIIEGMAHVGMGEPFIITHPEKAAAEAGKFRKMIQSPVLTDLNLDFGGFEAYDVEPLSIPDVLADRPVIVFGKWKGRHEGEIRIKGTSGKGNWEKSIDISEIGPLKSNSALKYLWARHRIMILSDYNKISPNDERIHKVTNLGLTYNLLTAYTSFIAVDTEVRNKYGKSTTITQPLPLPAGVSDYAVGGRGGQISHMMKYSAAPKMVEEIASKKEPTHKAKIKIENVTVTGGLSEKDILIELQKHLKESKGCYANNLHYRKMNVKLTLNAEGHVLDVAIARGSFKNGHVEKCLKQIISKFRFTRIANNKSVKVSFELVLQLVFPGRERSR